MPACCLSDHFVPPFSMLFFSIFGRKTGREKALIPINCTSGLDLAQAKPTVSLSKDLWIYILQIVAFIEQEKARFAQYSLVNKSWRGYSQPALYCNIHLHKSLQARNLAWTLKQRSPGYPEGFGKYVRFLKLATASYDRCDPKDILTILWNTSQLVSLYDRSSICSVFDHSIATALTEIQTQQCLEWMACPNTTSFLWNSLNQLKQLHICLPEGSQFLIHPFSLPLLQSLTLTILDPIFGSEGEARSPPGKMLDLLSLSHLPALRCMAIFTPYVLNEYTSKIHSGPSSQSMAIG